MIPPFVKALTEPREEMPVPEIVPMDELSGTALEAAAEEIEEESQQEDEWPTPIA